MKLAIIILFMFLFSSCAAIENIDKEYKIAVENCKTYYPQVENYGNGVYFLHWNSPCQPTVESSGYVLSKFKQEQQVKGFRIVSIIPKTNGARYLFGYFVILEPK